VLWSPAMGRPSPAVRGVLTAALLLATAGAGAQQVQIAPFAGYQFGGSVRSLEPDREYNFESGLAWGGCVDVALNEGWRVELLYSRQDTTLRAREAAASAFDVRVERYLLGLQEEKGEGSTRYFGTLLLGATRFVPGLGVADTDVRFTGGFALGVKSFFSAHVGLRLEARAFYTVVESGGGVFCTGGACLFRFSSSGIWQGDASGGLIFRF
jgi:hypothetical protein